MKKKSKWEWLYRILCFGLYDQLTAEYAAERQYKYNHWHPVSENPPVDERGLSRVYVVIDKSGFPYKAYFYSNEEENRQYWVQWRDWNLPEIVIDVKWWIEEPMLVCTTE